MSQVCQGVLLRLEQILKQRPGTDNSTVIVRKPQAGKARHLKMLQQFLAAHCIVKIPGIQRIDGDPKPLPQAVQIHSAHVVRLIADNLRR